MNWTLNTEEGLPPRVLALVVVLTFAVEILHDDGCVPARPTVTREACEETCVGGLVKKYGPHECECFDPRVEK